MDKLRQCHSNRDCFGEQGATKTSGTDICTKNQMTFEEAETKFINLAYYLVMFTLGYRLFELSATAQTLSLECFFLSYRVFTNEGAKL